MFGSRLELRLAAAARQVDEHLAAWKRSNYQSRLLDRDYRLWAPEPEPELGNRLGWLDLPGTPGSVVEEWKQLAREATEGGVEQVIVLGMGGSSLAPEVFAHSFDVESGLPLSVLDTTHPEAIAAATADIDVSSTLFLVSSKSGGTIETLSLFRHFWEARVGAVGRATAGQAFVAITDPGSGLERLAQEREFLQICPGPSDVGGRFSALSAFGMVPAALIGLDVDRMLELARGTAEGCFGPNGYDLASPLGLGAAMAELARVGRDKLTLLPSSSIGSFPDWLEQLVAESLGKLGRGVIPIVGERPRDPGLYSADRFLVILQVDGDEPVVSPEWMDRATAEGHPVAMLRLADSYDLGSQMYGWEFAVAAAGSLLGVQPFSQPDVQLAKDLANAAMDRAAGETGGNVGFETIRSSEPRARDVLQAWLSESGPGGYVSIQAFLAPNSSTVVALREFTCVVDGRTGAATTLGIGPRFLHSTGQLHKGGPESGRFLQIVDEPSPDLEVPETDYSFGRLIRAQADGDAGALAGRARPTLRLELDDRGPDELPGLLSELPAV